MTALSRCPFCNSEKVYSVLDTLHCKRCKNLWTEERVALDPAGTTGSGPPSRTPPSGTAGIHAALEIRLEQTLNSCLAMYNGRFSMGSFAWRTKGVPSRLVRQYLSQCVESGILLEKKDRSGRTWYTRP
jgi:hypothetical protein